MAGVILLLVLIIVIYSIDRFGPQRIRTQRTNILRPMEMPAAIATRKGIGLAIFDLAFVGVLLGFYPRHHWLIIFYGILGYVGFLIPVFHRLDRNKGHL
jgi:hypothetical protein